MDGRGRFLRSLGEGRRVFGASARLVAPLSASAGFAWSRPAREAGRPRPRRPRRGAAARLAAVLSRPGAGLAFAAVLFGAVGAYGAARGGHYDAMVAAYGQPSDIAARALGFGVDQVTVVGRNELTEQEILAAADVGPRNSLPFLDVAKVRQRLVALPLVREASVAKLYPNRLLVEIEEREPAALWQKDGVVHLVARDGAPLDQLRDKRFAALPLVVGEGADRRIGEYRAILEAAGPLAARVRAGIYVSGRRWNLKMADGVEVMLPEADPAGAAATLARLEAEAHPLDKAVLSLDLRQSGRVVARLTEEAAADRAALEAARKPKAKGAQQ